MSRYRLVLIVGLLGLYVPCLQQVQASNSATAGWAESLFDEVSRDFGSVPRGPTLTHPFRIVNKTTSTVQIAEVRPGCDCTKARALQWVLAPGQETAIMIEMDTRRFTGSRAVTIYVKFSQPQVDEVRLTVQANSRDDVFILPESLAFGKIQRGTAATTNATVTFQGVQNWQITGAVCDSNYVQMSFEQLRRGGGEAAYKLTAALRPDTPVGKWFTDVWLQTNNAASPRVRVPLTVEIEAPLTVSPSTVGLGEIKAGKIAERKVVVQGARPFRIVSVQGTDKELSVRDSTAESATVHVLTVTLQPKRAGELQRSLRVVTDLGGEETIEFQAVAQVVQ
jgi:hypothetical protein